MSQVKVNPTLANASRSFIGKELTGLTIDLAVNGTDFGTTEMGPNGAFQQVLNMLSQHGTIVGYSALRAAGGDEGQAFDVYFEGTFGTDTYDGTNSETFATFLATEFDTLTTAGARTAATIAITGETSNTGGVDLSSATVAAITGFPLIVK
jgi:hypothetical protein